MMKRATVLERFGAVAFLILFLKEKTWNEGILEHDSDGIYHVGRITSSKDKKGRVLRKDEFQRKSNGK